VDDSPATSHASCRCRSSVPPHQIAAASEKIKNQRAKADDRVAAYLDLFMTYAFSGSAASPAAELQRCDRSRIILVSTTRPLEGGFGT
jgi:hypothetical protein